MNFTCIKKRENEKENFQVNMKRILQLGEPQFKSLQTLRNKK